MKLRKLIALVCATSFFFWTPTIIGVSRAAPVNPCDPSGISWLLGDVAYANIPTPCSTSGKTPWGIWWIFAGAGSVILNALHVSHTQCRELTSQEAGMAAAIPFSWVFFNQKNNKCR